MDFNLKQEFNRKLIHLSSSIYPIAYIFLSKNIMAAIVAILFLAVFLWDCCRIRGYNFRIITIFSSFVREKESKRFIGATYFLAAILLVVVIFPKYIAIVSMFVLIFCDTAAALIGKTFGKNKIKGTHKSLEGFIAFIITGLVIMIIYLQLRNIADINSYLLAFLAVFITGMVELFSDNFKIDDNLSITLAMSICLYFFL
ncbi:MAG: SEC59/DGK1/VTE5 family protein [Alphaproteobacteria bacterium]|nr:SEC59/DGK1/VTE5 family protein [Alphaproteobacteria bacterium]